MNLQSKYLRLSQSLTQQRKSLQNEVYRPHRRRAPSLSVQMSGAANFSKKPQNATRPKFAFKCLSKFQMNKFYKYIYFFSNFQMFYFRHLESCFVMKEKGKEYYRIMKRNGIQGGRYYDLDKLQAKRQKAETDALIAKTEPGEDIADVINRIRSQD